MSNVIFQSRFILALLLMMIVLATSSAFAAGLPSPIGRWRTIDDRTGQPRGTVQVYEQGGQFFAKIETSTDPKDAARRCTACTDERKNQPIIGLVLMRGMMRDDGGTYSGGDILDPDTGKIYRCRLMLKDGGRRLVVRGFIGISLLGRSQNWLRE